jgi:hypothetical protein
MENVADYFAYMLGIRFSKSMWQRVWPSCSRQRDALGVLLGYLSPPVDSAAPMMGEVAIEVTFQ